MWVVPQKNIHCLNNPTPTIDPQEIANSFGQNFSSAFRLNKELLNPTPNYIPTKTAIEIEKDITFIEFSSALNTLKGRTPGYDRISYCMIKNLPTTFKQRIINLYNEIHSSHIRQSFKLSLLLPILKPHKPQTDIKSYRPISLNSCLAKILDKIMAKRLWWFVLNNELIHNSQSGFYVDHLASRSIALKKHLQIISLDFTKAFDKSTTSKTS